MQVHCVLKIWKIVGRNCSVDRVIDILRVIEQIAFWTLLKQNSQIDLC